MADLFNAAAPDAADPPSDPRDGQARPAPREGSSRAAEPDQLDRQRARRLPKVLLHDHLDGGLRIPTLLDLARQRGVAVPAEDAETLSAWFDARAHAGSLVEYLRGFALTVAAMATPQGLERVAYEAAEDARQDGCVLAEFRIAPLLFEAHGVSGEAAVEALLAGLARSSLPTGLIVCAMRQLDDAEIERAAMLALRYRERGVVAFDLAGPEAGYPATRHAALLARLRDEGLPLTLHAGEADEGLRVVEAARLGARRVGHGVRLADLLGQPGGQALVDEVKAAGVHLEVCPTSNVHTGAAASIATHPIQALWQAGLSLSFHTDNQLISCLDTSTEALNLVQQAGFGWDDLLRMELLAVDASFLPAPQRAQARQALLDWAAAEGLVVA